MTATAKSVSICAVIAVRNEFLYLRRLLPLLAQQQIDVAIIDNESTDESRDLFRQHAGSPVLSVIDLPYRGYFSLTEQLRLKQSVYEQLSHDWIIHHDADEILEHAQAGRTLRDSVQEADDAGCNVLNFEEFVFLPEPGADFCNLDYRSKLLRYYFFEPDKNRLQRAWKRTATSQNLETGGHRLRGAQLRVFPVNHVMRHYIVLSEEHARVKYLNRRFDSAEIARGWHANRLAFTESNLRFPAQNQLLQHLRDASDQAFRKDRPTSAHYWDWHS